MKLIAIFVVLILSVGSWAQVPPEVAAMNDLPNAAQLYITYCSVGDKVCVDRKAICYGQCGDQENADEMGYDCAGNIEGTVPRGYHYARWYAIDFQNGKRYGGKATKGYDIKRCRQWPR